MPLSSEKISQKISIIEKIWNDFIIENDNTINIEYDINERNLIEVIVRVDKRKDYYNYFHDLNSISEFKETALLCFWIIKLKPFTILKKDSVLRNSTNEMFSLYLIFGIIKRRLDMLNKTFSYPPERYIKDIIYSFKYRDLSKEAMILLVDSLANSYGINAE